MRILLTNDDGIQAVGLRALYHAFREAGHEVRVVAPVTEQSAVGHAITISLPLRVKEFKEDGFEGLGVYGTPTDCVKLALTALLDPPPDVVVSGINAGANVGVDLLYSGTVSAATEGAFMGYPAIAFSHDCFNPVDLTEQGRYAARLLPTLPWGDLPAKCVLNLNFPDLPVAECKPLILCRHTRVMWEDSYMHRLDPRGRPYYWLTGEIPPEKLSPDTDRALLTAGHITLTPLKFDFTDRDTLALLERRMIVAAPETDASPR
ncbi:5'/3'-nucleotidase SurE [Megalodesulfovibrio gigas]|uniref:5'-nucleotidase SurE n=1 Tax=Megalodesulfovibrio gigas (strain ATCC 19364 / DSM 1382 / NCIMB 9332 / VKM B-1759) TaxID=1121448 RepID=T2GDF3_MEGG1|nr:5'/3'-nucleotidase SurE [Megalodesulfovibrio gigas]AGW13947.1 putative stationary-phase survival protein SurE [Megalodesulfovibrio gigas DSM 1382 = ATCC 19364]